MISGVRARFLYQYLISAKIFFIIFYAVGVTGLLWPVFSSYFKSLIPLALLLSFFALTIYHENYSIRTGIYFLAIYLVSFAVEVIGVKTHIFFGAYLYGESLGIKIFDTPLIIGLNWLLLVYLTAAITEDKKWHAAVKVIVASLVMLIYDLILEQVAPMLDMWHWHGRQVPLKNYLTWFIFAVIFHAAAKIFHIKMHNKLAPVILVCQMLFLLSLFFIFKPE
jgi:bisanhydrobacterioruberin hydratase